MPGSRYETIPAGTWPYLGPAFRALDADLAAVEAGGGGGVFPGTSLLNTQSPDGSWDIPKAQVDAAHTAGYRVHWVTDAAAGSAPTFADGLAVKDVVNGEVHLAGPPVATPVTIQAGEVPTAQDNAGTADTITLTKVTGVTWTIGGVDHPSSAMAGATKVVPHTTGANISVTAKPEAGYEITNQTISWALSFTDTGGGPPEGVVFEDDFGASALSSAQVNARTTPTGGVSMTTAGTGTVTVNSSGKLVLDGTAGAAAIDFSAGGTTGKFTVVVDSVTGTMAGNWAALQLRTGTAGNKLVANFNQQYGFAQAQVGGAGDGDTWRAATYPATFVATAGESGGTLTVGLAGTNPASSDARAGSFAGNGKTRIFCPAGRIVTVSSVKFETS